MKIGPRSCELLTRCKLEYAPEGCVLVLLCRVPLFWWDLRFVRVVWQLRVTCLHHLDLHVMIISIDSFVSVLQQHRPNILHPAQHDFPAPNDSQADKQQLVIESLYTLRFVTTPQHHGNVVQKASNDATPQLAEIAVRWHRRRTQHPSESRP